MYITEYEIALKSYEQLQGTTAAELKLYAKALGLSGYSKMKKAELVELVFKGSNVKRQDILNETAREQRESELAIKGKQEAKTELQQQDSPMQCGLLVKLYKNLKPATDKKPASRTPEIMADILYDRCVAHGYQPITIAKGMTRTLKANLEKATDIPTKFREDLRTCWNQKVYHINYEQKIKETKQVKRYADEFEKTFDNTASIIQWAVDAVTR